MMTGLISGCAAPAQELFDDFHYASSSDPALAANGWQVRSGAGGPGPEGAMWSSDSVTFVPDEANSGHTLLQLAALTTGSQVIQSEINTDFKYQWGTFAARVKFSNQPTSGPDGDQIVETFFTIAPWQAEIYSELDFEYLANGGWDQSGPRLWMTSWDTPKNNDHSDYAADLSDGWHILLVTATADKAIYYVDGVQRGGPHLQPFAPKRLTAIDFNLWFIQPGVTGLPRTYIEQVDWVYHVKDEVWSDKQVQAAVKRLQVQGKSFVSTIP